MPRLAEERPHQQRWPFIQVFGACFDLTQENPVHSAFNMVCIHTAILRETLVVIRANGRNPSKSRLLISTVFSAHRQGESR